MSPSTADDGNAGAGDTSPHTPIALPEGTRLRDQYRIGAVLGAGSFGITYRARDERLDTTVAIKEYYPHEIAGRTQSRLTLQPYDDADAADFAFGRERFMEEGRTLARFDHPNIVRVRSYFEAHGTGYLVMDHYEGQTLASYLAEHGGTLPEAEAVEVIQDVLRGLQPVHEEGLLHRDIDPQNIYRTDEGRVVLLDFGAARVAMGERSEGELVVFKPGYAPYEQYFEDGEQGPWTDVYACAATLYKCLTGVKPPEATIRIKEDELVPPHEVTDDVSLDTSVAVMKGLAVDPDRRPESVEAFAALLTGDANPAPDDEAPPRPLSAAELPTERGPRLHSPDGSDDTEDEVVLPLSFRKAYLIGVLLLLAAGTALFYVRGMSETSGPSPPARSIAVLPFEDVGTGDSRQFARGIHDDLLTRLSRVSDLQVISRTSVMQYAGTNRSLPDIARSLGVKWVVEGTIQQAGDQVQVTAQLINARRDTHAWARSYRRALTPENLFAIQDELTRKIAQSLEATLTVGETERIERRPTDNLGAYRFYVQGRALLDQRSDQGIRQAATYFRRALAEDSSYALAWAGLADARSLLSLYGYAPADSVLPAAERAAERAVDLDPDLAEAHASLGLVHDYRRDGPVAVRQYTRALDLNPNYARAHQWLGNLYLALGRLSEARSHLETAAELDPMSPSIHAALAGVYNRQQPPQPEPALRHASRAQELASKYAAAHIVEGVALSRSGRHEQALRALDRGLGLAAPGDGVRQLHLGKPAVTHVRMGNTAQARARLDTLEQNGESPYAQAEVHAALGNVDAAFADLQRVTWDKFLAAELRYGPALDSLRDDPRFQNVLRTANRAWGLRPDGALPSPADSTGMAASAGANR
jgi:TolB-like protein